MKKCFKCGIKKKLELFYKHPQMADGHVNKCKSCNRKDNSLNFWSKREFYREYDKTREKTEHRKSKKIEYQRKRRLLYKGKNAARAKLNRAIKNGIIKRLNCEVCGEGKAEGHHTDYRKPYQVRWLCFTHHRKEHGQLKC